MFTDSIVFTISPQTQTGDRNHCVPHLMENTELILKYLRCSFYYKHRIWIERIWFSISWKTDSNNWSGSVLHFMKNTEYKLSNGFSYLWKTQTGNWNICVLHFMKYIQLKLKDLGFPFLEKHRMSTKLNVFFISLKIQSKNWNKSVVRLMENTEKK